MFDTQIVLQPVCVPYTRLIHFFGCVAFNFSDKFRFMFLAYQCVWGKSFLVESREAVIEPKWFSQPYNKVFHGGEAKYDYIFLCFLHCSEWFILYFLKYFNKDD